MTVIVALVDGKRVWFGADAMSTDTDDILMQQSEMLLPKIIPIGKDVLVALAGEHINHSLVRFHKPPTPVAGVETVVWIQTNFLPWLEKKQDLLSPKKRRGSILIGRGHELFMVEVANCDAVPVTSAAIGSGASYALGAIHALGELPTLTGRDRVAAGVRAACHYDPYCGGRIDVMHTGPVHSTDTIPEA